MIQQLTKYYIQQLKKYIEIQKRSEQKMLNNFKRIFGNEKK